MLCKFLNNLLAYLSVPLTNTFQPISNTPNFFESKTTVPCSLYTDSQIHESSYLIDVDLSDHSNIASNTPLDIDLGNPCQLKKLSIYSDSDKNHQQYNYFSHKQLRNVSKYVKQIFRSRFLAQGISALVFLLISSYFGYHTYGYFSPSEDHTDIEKTLANASIDVSVAILTDSKSGHFLTDNGNNLFASNANVITQTNSRSKNDSIEIALKHDNFAENGDDLEEFDDVSAQELAEIDALFANRKKRNTLLEEEINKQREAQLLNPLYTRPKIRPISATDDQISNSSNTTNRPDRNPPRAAPDAVVTLELNQQNSQLGNNTSTADLLDFDPNEIDALLEPLASSGGIAENVPLENSIDDTTIEVTSNSNVAPPIVTFTNIPNPTSSQSASNFNDGLTSIFDDDEFIEVTSPSNTLTDGASDEVNNLPGNNSNFVISWLENFDGTALDLRRFVTPGSQIIEEDNALILNLEAAHAEENQKVNLHQQISLVDANRSVSAQLSMLNMSSPGVSSSQIVIKIPLERIDVSENEQSQMVACFILDSELVSSEKSVKLALYEGTKCIGIDTGVVSLGETTFSLEQAGLTPSNALTILSFSLNVDFSDHVELTTNQINLNIPVKVRFPQQSKTLDLKISTQAASGENSKIDASLTGLSINNERLSDLKDRLITKDSVASVGHSLRLQDGAARLEATGTENVSRVLLASRSELNELDWIQNSESTSFMADIQIKEIKQSGISNREEDSNLSSISVLHTLFELQSENDDQQIIAVLRATSSENTSNQNNLLVEVTAALISRTVSQDRDIDWYDILDESSIISEISLGKLIIQNDTIPIKIDQNRNNVSFTWDNTTVQLPHNFETMWNPSSISTTAAIVLANSGDTMVIELDRMGVERR